MTKPLGQTTENSFCEHNLTREAFISFSSLKEQEQH